MRHIKDIYPLVNEVRQRIIEKMRAENIVLVQFCPANEEEYMEEHKDEDSVQDYANYRDEVCPNVVYFDKYGCGYEYVVLSVSLVGTTDPHLKLYCDSGELGSDTFMDSDVYDMTWVYELLEKHLGLEEQDEPQKFKCAVVFGSRATSRYDEQDFEGLHEVCRDGDGSIVIREFDTEAERKAFIEGIEAGDGWCDYMEVDQTDIENVTFDDI